MTTNTSAIESMKGWEEEERSLGDGLADYCGYRWPSWRWFAPVALEPSSGSFFVGVVSDPDDYDPRDPAVASHFRRIEAQIAAGHRIVWPDEPPQGQADKREGGGTQTAEGGAPPSPAPAVADTAAPAPAVADAAAPAPAAATPPAKSEQPQPKSAFTAPSSKKKGKGAPAAVVAPAVATAEVASPIAAAAAPAVVPAPAAGTAPSPSAARQLEKEAASAAAETARRLAAESARAVAAEEAAEAAAEAAREEVDPPPGCLSRSHAGHTHGGCMHCGPLTLGCSASGGSGSGSLALSESASSTSAASLEPVASSVAVPAVAPKEGAAASVERDAPPIQQAPDAAADDPPVPVAPAVATGADPPAGNSRRGSVDEPSPLIPPVASVVEGAPAATDGEPSLPEEEVSHESVAVEEAGEHVAEPVVEEAPAAAPVFQPALAHSAVEPGAVCEAVEAPNDHVDLPAAGGHSGAATALPVPAASAGAIEDSAPPQQQQPLVEEGEGSPASSLGQPDPGDSPTAPPAASAFPPPLLRSESLEEAEQVLSPGAGGTGPMRRRARRRD